MRQQTKSKAAAKTAKSARAKGASSVQARKTARPAPATAKKFAPARPTPKKGAPKKAAVVRKAPKSGAKPTVSTGGSKAGKAAKAIKDVAKPAVKSAARAGKAAGSKTAKAVKPAAAATAKTTKPAAASVVKAVKPAIKGAAKAVKPEAFAQQVKPAVKTAAELVDSVRKIATEFVKPAVKAATELVDSALHATTAPAPVPVPVAAPVSVPAPKPAAPATKAGKKAAATTVQVISEPIAPAKPPVVSSEIPVSSKSGALYYDSHMHTPLCKHAIGEPEEYAEQGIKAGLKGIIFTCHCPMPDGYWPMVRMTDSEFDTYVAMVQRAANAYKGKIDVCLGLESEFFPGHEKWIENLHQRAEFHFVLGGLHWQSKDYLGRFETGTIENFRRSYFEHLAQTAETGLYDCLAHPDLVKNYHPDSWCFAIVKNTAAAALDRIAKTGVAMEINTSGLNKSYSEMNPGLEMLRMMADRKIPVVIGSDAHKPLRVGEHFVTALNHLTEVGYEKVSYFQRRERIDLKISEVLASIKKAADANA